MRAFPEIVVPIEVFDADLADSKEIHRQTVYKLWQAFRSTRFARIPESQKWKQELRRVASSSTASKEFAEWFLKNKRALSDAVEEGDSFGIARNLHSRRRVDGMLLDCVSDIPENFSIPTVKALDVQDGEPDWWGPGETAIAISPDGLPELLSPLLRYGREVHIVERYFSPSQPLLVQRIKKLLDVVRGNPNKPKVFIHTSLLKLSQWAAEKGVLVDEVGLCFASEMPSVTKFPRLCICAWKNGIHGDEMLDRYLLTDIGGFALGHVLTVAGAGNAVVSVLSQTPLEQLRDRYFRVADHVEREGVRMVCGAL